jgi:Fic family protein
MRIPRTPPNWLDAIDQLVNRMPVSVGNRSYLHWDELRHRQPPEGLNHEQWWACIKFQRTGMYNPLPLESKNGLPFKYALAVQVQEKLHRLDRDAAGGILISETGIPADARDRYIIKSLREEAISSSLLEGAATTRQQAKEMLRSRRAPRSKGERMVINNYHAMEHLRSKLDEPLTPGFIFELHQILTDGTLDTPDAAGRLRKAEENISVFDNEKQILHEPPPAATLPSRMQSMCDFANNRPSGEFIHPVIRAILLHFWLAYDHPFVDGNGRCARALFYWAMLRTGYWLFEFVSISQLLLEAPVKYGQAFLFTETDDNDCTYFLLHQLDVTEKGAQRLQSSLRQQVQEMQNVEGLARHSGNFNHRQLSLLSHALRHGDARYTIESHRSSQRVSYATARSDLFQLVELGLLEKRISGKAFYFLPVEHLRERLASR